MQVATGARPTWVLWAFLGIAAFFLITEHTAHFLGALPWLLLLACPFLHMFGHGGHGGHGDHQQDPDHQHDEHHAEGVRPPGAAQ